MKKRFFGILVLFLIAAAVVLIRFRWAGRVDSPALPAPTLATVDRIRLCFSDTCFMEMDRKASGHWTARSGKLEFLPDASRIDDFLHVFGLWEIVGMPTDSQQAVWQEILERQGGNLLLKAGRRTVLDIGFGRDGDVFFVKTGRKTFYSMQSVWQALTWMSFFEPDLRQWQNRILLDLDYLQVVSVSVKYAEDEAGFRDSYELERTDAGVYLLRREGRAADTLLADAVHAYLSAFRQVYFDIPAMPGKPGTHLYDVRIGAEDGPDIVFQAFEKQSGTGEADLFKAVVITETNGARDTVEVPYAVLDKIVKTAGWFVP